MTLLLEAPLTTGTDQTVQRAGANSEALTSPASVAVRAHALLSQTMSDEELDELVEGAGPRHCVVLPVFFFG